MNKNVLNHHMNRKIMNEWKNKRNGTKTFCRQKEVFCPQLLCRKFFWYVFSISNSFSCFFFRAYVIFTCSLVITNQRRGQKESERSTSNSGLPEFLPHVFSSIFILKRTFKRVSKCLDIWAILWEFFASFSHKSYVRMLMKQKDNVFTQPEQKKFFN